MLRVAFMGTPSFAVPALNAIHRTHQIVGVFTQPDRPMGRGLELKPSAVKAEAFRLDLGIHQPEHLGVSGILDSLKALAPDLIVVVAYGQILKKEVLRLPRMGCVNLHSSLLPRWRGAAPIQWSILSGDRETGVTAIQLVEKLDAGDILLQARTPITDEDTAESLHDRLAQMGAELMVSTLSGLEAGTLHGKPQIEAEVTYAPKLSKEMEWLDPDCSAELLARKIRALNPWPGTSVWVESGTGQRLKIREARVRSDIAGPPGEIFTRAGMILLGTTNGSLELLKLHWEGKSEVDPNGFLCGLRGRGQALPLRVIRHDSRK